MSQKQIAKLICVSEENNNKYYNMAEQDNGTFIAEYGRVDQSKIVESYPMSRWNEIYNKKIRPRTVKGKTYQYVDITHLFMENTANSNGDNGYFPISDRVVQDFVNTLMSYADKHIEQNYSVSSKSVTQAQINAAQNVIDELVNLMTTSDIHIFNKKLLELYRVIPRKMKNVKDALLIVHNDSIKQKIIANEQSTLDTMANQVQINTSTDDTIQQQNQTILDAFGISISSTSDDELLHIKKLMDVDNNGNKLSKAFKISVNKTEKSFDDFVESSDNKNITLLWHGSRNENWWGIVNNGLLIRPSNAVHTGSLFGDGIYFANKSQKSIGYTSVDGSYWANGKSKRGYLALYKVHTGNSLCVEKEVSNLHRNMSAKNLPNGFHSLHARAGVIMGSGSRLRNDEIIIYRKEQCTIKYIVEIK